MRALVLFSAMAFLAACTTSTPTGQSAQTAEEKAAAEVAEQFPDLDVNAIASCVRDNATEDELILLSVGGEAAQQMTASILGRPGTQQCIIDSGVELPQAT